MVENLRVTQETWVQSLGQEDPLEKAKPLQYSCLENPMDGGAWWATVHEVAKSQTRLSDFTHSTCLQRPVPHWVYYLTVGGETSYSGGVHSPLVSHCSLLSTHQPVLLLLLLKINPTVLFPILI